VSARLLRHRQHDGGRRKTDVLRNRRGGACVQRRLRHFRPLFEFEDGGAQGELRRIGWHHLLERISQAPDRARVEL